jgi:hypothetical protein
MLEASVKEAVTPERCLQAHEGVGFFHDIEGNLQYDPMRVIPEHKFAAAKALVARSGAQVPAPGGDEPVNHATKCMLAKEEAYEVAMNIMRADLEPQVKTHRGISELTVHTQVAHLVGLLQTSIVLPYINPNEHPMLPLNIVHILLRLMYMLNTS